MKNSAFPQADISAASQNLRDNEKPPEDYEYSLSSFLGFIVLLTYFCPHNFNHETNRF